jgi:hypothetical protein
VGATRVSTPGGTAWTVRRRWVPHRDGVGFRARFAQRRSKRRDQRSGESRESAWYDGLDIPDFGADLEGLAIILAIVVAIVVLALFGWPLVLVGIDLAWLLLVSIFGVIGRVVLRRPWRVEARSGDERRHWYIQGYRAAGRHRDEIARQFQHGQNPHGDAPAPVSH